jgi:hypothetical protein
MYNHSETFAHKGNIPSSFVKKVLDVLKILFYFGIICAIWIHNFFPDGAFQMEWFA